MTYRRQLAFWAISFALSLTALAALLLWPHQLTPDRDRAWLAKLIASFLVAISVVELRSVLWVRHWGRRR